jgi:hypothetical protein
MVAVTSLVSSATAVRVSLGCLELWGRRTPPLLGRAMTASIGGEQADSAQTAFREEVLALARESAEISWRELRRGVDDLDKLTRPPQDEDARPHRPYRVKP